MDEYIGWKTIDHFLFNNSRGFSGNGYGFGDGGTAIGNGSGGAPVSSELIYLMSSFGLCPEGFKR